MSSAPPAPAYRERLSVPIRWWAQGTMLIATLWLAVFVAVPPVGAWIITAIAVGLMAALFLSYGSALVEVADGRLRAGRARIDLAHVGAVEPLDAESTRLAFGRDADVRAYLLLRPYRKRSVRVRIVDPRDPTPYWLISTRRPTELAAAIEAARPARPRG
ncbi:DUF3093 domain-containing protein [Nocardioides sp. TRM66260-LWL]|uniref:DUF3093 domain-containing protein n=1 Tax=Nocardioides sp. TRM66260-LWL TaxID=2874478 RepID=UPI001CC78A55|nr:DUF3093 domain-containing protein [Nocardioides sp. TRM66260-LWL]MBZ5733742.1 DUF3093 domain-containing protein [Nocardioides sp. TRM66260-LWL]